MKLIESYKQFIKQQGLFAANDLLLLAVSGGVDSVVLCELCKQAGFQFIIAHCNFQLRADESDRDEEFVKQLGVKYEVEVLTKQFDTNGYASTHRLSIQEAARALRYSWFAEIAKEMNEKNSIAVESTGSHSSIFLLTAHHADDNSETILMNFCRGTGLHGLSGIPIISGHIRRPMLSFSKEDIVLFAKENNLAYVEDSSNQSSRYTRNLFRNEIMPLISKVYPQVKENLQDNIRRFNEIEKLYKFSVGTIIKTLSKKKGEEIHIPIKQLMGFSSNALIFEIFAPYGFLEKQVEEINKLATSDSGKYLHSPTRDFRIIKHRHWFIISPSQSTAAENFVIDEGQSSLDFGAGILQIETGKTPLATISQSPLIAQVDASGIQFPLLLRKWKTGDYFYPLGMKKKKKLSRFFIDQKLSKSDKEKVWVIEMNKTIVWVVGMRIDERFRIREGTKEILKLTVSFY
jgi:tRNA(Ile)-lysidine synthase